MVGYTKLCKILREIKKQINIQYILFKISALISISVLLEVTTNPKSVTIIPTSSILYSVLWKICFA